MVSAYTPKGPLNTEYLTWKQSNVKILNISTTFDMFLSIQTKLESTFWAQVPWLTKEVDYEAVAIAVDVGGRVWLELDCDISGGSVELKSGL